MRRLWLPPLASAVAAFGYFSVATAYPWQFALLAATAVGALAYSTQVTWRRMRRLAQIRPPDECGGSIEEPPPERSGE